LKSWEGRRKIDRVEIKGKISKKQLKIKARLNICAMVVRFLRNKAGFISDESSF